MKSWRIAYITYPVRIIAPVCHLQIFSVLFMHLGLGLCATH